MYHRVVGRRDGNGLIAKSEPAHTHWIAVEMVVTQHRETPLFRIKMEPRGVNRVNQALVAITGFALHRFLFVFLVVGFFF